MATTTGKKKEGLFRTRKSGLGAGKPELTTKGLIVVGGIIVVLGVFILWSVMQ